MWAATRASSHILTLSQLKGRVLVQRVQSPGFCLQVHCVNWAWWFTLLIPG